MSSHCHASCCNSLNRTLKIPHNHCTPLGGGQQSSLSIPCKRVDLCSGLQWWCMDQQQLLQMQASNTVTKTPPLITMDHQQSPSQAPVYLCLITAQCDGLWGAAFAACNLAPYNHLLCVGSGCSGMARTTVGGKCGIHEIRGGWQDQTTWVGWLGSVSLGWRCTCTSNILPHVQASSAASKHGGRPEPGEEEHLAWQRPESLHNLCLLEVDQVNVPVCDAECRFLGKVGV